MSRCRIRRVRHYEGLCFCISSCAQKKRVLRSKCDDQSFLSFAQHLPSVPVNECNEVKIAILLEMGRRKLPESTSNKKGRTYEVPCFCISSCAQKKRVLCSKCDDQNLLKFAHHLPLGPVNVC